MFLERPSLIVICGWPLSGKSTIAKIVHKKLNEGHGDPLIPRVHWADIDDVRRTCIGLPHPHPDESETLMEKDKVEMGGAYDLLFETARWHMKHHRSCIITATFSRRTLQESLSRIYHDSVATARDDGGPSQLFVIQCILKNDPQEEIKRRLTRGFGKEYVGGVNSYKRYLEVKKRYETISLPHLEIDTSPPHTPMMCAEQTLKYICP